MQDSGQQKLVAPHYRVGWGPYIPRILLLVLLYGIMTAVTVMFGEGEYYPLAAFLFVVIYLIWVTRRGQQQSLQNTEGIRRLSVGDYGAAADIFEALCCRPVSPGWHLMFVFNRGVAYQVMGDFDLAFALYDSVLNASGFGIRKAKAVHGDLLRAYIAAGIAWGGELEKAEAILTALGSDVKDPGALVASRAIIALRRGDAASALQIIESGWSDAESLLRGMELKPLRILWAFTLQTLGRESDEAFAHQMAEISPHDAEITAWCGTRWPEMATFVQSLQNAP